MIDEDNDEWTTVFYKAIVTEPVTKSESVADQTVSLIFPPDRDVYQVDISKVVPRTVRPKAPKAEPPPPETNTPELKRAAPPRAATAAKRPKISDSPSSSQADDNNQVPIIIKKESVDQSQPLTGVEGIFRVNFSYSTPGLSSKKKLLRNYQRLNASRRQPLPVE